MRAFPLLLGALLSAGAGSTTLAQIRPQQGLDPTLQQFRPPTEDVIRLGGGQASPAPSSPGSDVVQTTTLESLLGVAKQIGFSDARLVELEDKSKYVGGEAGGAQVGIFPFECDKGACRAITFIAFFGKQDEVDLNFVNAYNVRYLSKLTLDNEKNVGLNLTIKLYGGVRQEHISQMGGVFIQAIKDAIEFKPT